MGIMIIVLSYKEPKGNGRGGKNFSGILAISCCITQIHVISVT